ncbi:MAG: TetR family transcriptional regulator C-terminal domain-containing protein [Massilia sp.]
MSRRPNTDERRRQIVHALMLVMAEHGYEKATIALIARQAGLAPGLLHYHFPTKASILLELVRMLAALSQQRFAALAAPATTPGARLRAYIGARLGKGEGADPAAVAAWVVIGAEAVRQPEVRAVYQDAVKAERDLLRGLLADCLRAQGKPLTNASRLCAGLLAFMEGAFQLASAAPNAIPAGFAAKTAIELVERYIDAE